MPFRSILVPVDRSEPSRAAIAAAADLAERLDAELTFFFLDPETESTTHIFVDRAHVPMIAGASNAYAHRSVAQLISALEDLGTVHQAPMGEVTSPAVAIVRASADFDLVVLGTHGRTGAARVLHGSVTEDVVRHSHAPVLVVHASEPRAVAASG